MNAIKYFSFNCFVLTWNWLYAVALQEDQTRWNLSSLPHPIPPQIGHPGSHVFTTGLLHPRRIIFFLLGICPWDSEMPGSLSSSFELTNWVCLRESHLQLGRKKFKQWLQREKTKVEEILRFKTCLCLGLGGLLASGCNPIFCPWELWDTHGSLLINSHSLCQSVWIGFCYFPPKESWLRLFNQINPEAFPFQFCISNHV